MGKLVKFSKTGFNAGSIGKVDHMRTVQSAVLTGLTGPSKDLPLTVTFVPEVLSEAEAMAQYRERQAERQEDCKKFKEFKL